MEELESARERLARLRSVAERAAHLEPGGGASPLRAGFPQAAEWVGLFQGRGHGALVQAVALPCGLDGSAGCLEQRQHAKQTCRSSTLVQRSRPLVHVHAPLCSRPCKVGNEPMPARQPPTCWEGPSHPRRQCCRLQRQPPCQLLSTPRQLELKSWRGIQCPPRRSSRGLHSLLQHQELQHLPPASGPRHLPLQLPQQWQPPLWSGPSSSGAVWRRRRWACRVSVSLWLQAGQGSGAWLLTLIWQPRALGETEMRGNRAAAGSAGACLVLREAAPSPPACKPGRCRVSGMASQDLLCSS